jgi:hypothetical protein
MERASLWLMALWVKVEVAIITAHSARHGFEGLGVEGKGRIIALAHSPRLNSYDFGNGVGAGDARGSEVGE